jgi:hypothetical protein
LQLKLTDVLGRTVEDTMESMGGVFGKAQFPPLPSSLASPSTNSTEYASESTAPSGRRLRGWV